MIEKTINRELRQALEALDGDREAEPLLSLHRSRTAAREEAIRALDEARKLAVELESEITGLDAGLAELEQRIVALADEREAGEPVSGPGQGADPDELERIREIHGRIEQVTRGALERTRTMAAAQPASPIPAERLRPGFAVGAAFRVPGRAGVPGRTGLVPGQAVGVRNARGAAQRMIETKSKDHKADKAEE